MKTNLLKLILLCTGLFPTLLLAQLTPLPMPPAPSIAAKAYVLRDFYSNQTIIEQNSNERIEPASLTKLMTSYIVFAALKQKQITANQVVPVSPRAWRAEGSRMFIEPNKPVTVDELIHGMIVQSGNDACIALAELIAGSEEQFAALMNREATRMGLKNTHFMNSTGLPHPQHYTSAHDLAVISAALIRDFPEYYPLYSVKEYKYNNISQANRNRLLWTDPYVDGLKTGHTENAKYCLASSAKRNNRRVVAVVIGAASDNVRTTESQKLLNYGLQFFDTMRVYEKGKAVATIPVWKGANKTLQAGFPYDVYLTLPKGQAEKLKANMETKQPMFAPITTGQRVGTVKLTIDGKPFAQYPLVALENVTQAGFFGRTWDSIRLFFGK